MVTQRRLGLLLASLALAPGCKDSREEAEQSATAIPPPSMVETDGEEAIALDSAAIVRIGLRTVVVHAVTRAPEVELPAIVVEDPGAMTVVRTGVGGRLSPASGTEWPRIGTVLHAGDPLAQVGDALPVTVPRGGTVTRLPAQPGELVQPGQELLALVDYSTPLVRVSWSVEAGDAPGRIGLTRLGGGPTIDATLAGAAPAGDPLTLGPAILYHANGAALRPGEALIARVPTARGVRRGILIPGSAVVQWDGLTWAFVERAPGHYVRLQVPSDAPVPGGWLVERGFADGASVVTVAAGQLLAEEFRARITVGEEVGE
ncbi:MAG: HlyD family efflux transporter periplasmic adaptor subunit [Gemmatimonadales bacterium]